MVSSKITKKTYEDRTNRQRINLDDVPEKTPGETSFVGVTVGERGGDGSSQGLRPADELSRYAARGHRVVSKTGGECGKGLEKVNGISSSNSGSHGTSESRVDSETSELNWGSDADRQQAAGTEIDREVAAGTVVEVTTSGRDRDLIIIQRTCIRAVTIKVKMSVCGEDVMAVVDSGAEVTIWSSGHFHRLPEDKKPRLFQTDTHLVVVDKQSRLAAEGVVLAKLSIHNKIFDR